VEGTPDETVIEAQIPDQKFGDFAATDHVDLPSSAARFSACSAPTAREIHHL
jgi:hypothetical protein